MIFRFYAQQYTLLAATLRGTSKASSLMGSSKDDTLKESTKTIFREKLPLMKEHCEDIGLRLSALYAENFFNDLDNITYGEIGIRCSELEQRVHDELSLCFLLQVPAERISYYEDADLFGPKVTASFPKVAYDVEEAGKCFALDRDTACVIHLMRVVEAAIDAIALGVGVPKTAVNSITTWEHLLREINNKIRENNASQVPTWHTSRPFYEGALAYLHSVKDAWRNPSIHDLERKYTESEAERIYTAIKHLMEHLAEHLNEDGVYTA